MMENADGKLRKKNESEIQKRKFNEKSSKRNVEKLNFLERKF